jgi:hypothetical protein
MSVSNDTKEKFFCEIKDLLRDVVGSIKREGAKRNIDVRILFQVELKDLNRPN